MIQIQTDLVLQHLFAHFKELNILAYDLLA